MIQSKVLFIGNGQLKIIFVLFMFISYVILTIVIIHTQKSFFVSGVRDVKYLTNVKIREKFFRN